MIRSRSLWRRCVLAVAVALPLSPGPAGVSAREVPLTILHTTDLHGHLLPWTDYEGRRDVGGLLRCATAISRVRAEQGNVLLIDCGDLVQGGAESWLTQGRSMVKALELLQYDAWILGNHDFDWGIDTLGRLHDATVLPLLAANVGVIPGRVSRLPKVQPFVVRDVDGVRVAIVGATTPGIPSWLMPESYGSAVFQDAVPAVGEALRRVKSLEPDVLVLAVHQGLQEFGDDEANEVNALAAAFPEFDLILGGHTHRLVGSTRVNGILYSQAGYHGNWLGRVDLVYDTVRRRVVRAEAGVIEIGDCYEADPVLAAALEPELAAARRFLGRELGSTRTELAATLPFPGQSDVQQLIARAIAGKTGADIVLHGVFGKRGLGAGPIRMQDVWELVPYENLIGTLDLTVSELAEVLEENLAFAGTTHFLGVYGIEYDVDLAAAPGARVRNLRLADGVKPHGRKRFRVAASSYALASGGGRYPALQRLTRDAGARLAMTDIDTRTAVVDYVRKHRPLDKVPGRRANAAP